MRAVFRRNFPLALGVCALAGLIGAIFNNALRLQPPKHPAPIFARVVKDIPAPEKRAIVSQELLREVQTALLERGYYSGAIDGKFGIRTHQAIIAFQEANALEVNGRASIELLSSLARFSSPAVAEDSTRPSRLRSLIRESLAPSFPKPRPEKSVPEKPKIAETGLAEPNPEAELDSDLIARIQAGLRNYGYDELVIDGRPGHHTKTAIRRFQLDYGMKITGEADQKVLDKLREIGAYRQG